MGIAASSARARFSSPASAATLAVAAALLVVISGAQRRGLLATSGEWFDEHNAGVAALPLNIAAEVQLIYKPYLERGRKLSHLPYKVVRCAAPSELARDAGGKRAWMGEEPREAARAHEAGITADAAARSRSSRDCCCCCCCCCPSAASPVGAYAVGADGVVGA